MREEKSVNEARCWVLAVRSQICAKIAPEFSNFSTWLVRKRNPGAHLIHSTWVHTQVLQPNTPHSSVTIECLAALARSVFRLRRQSRAGYAYNQCNCLVCVLR